MTKHGVHTLKSLALLKPYKRENYQHCLWTTRKKLNELGLGGFMPLYTIALFILQVFQWCPIYNNPCYFLNVHMLAEASSAWLHGLHTFLI